MMDKEFLLKLKETLQLIDSRLSAVEHIVNDVIIGGLQKAADEYADDEAYSVFVDTYGNTFEDLVEPSRILYGEDYDLSSDLYETMKGVDRTAEGFDEAAEVQKLIQSLRDKVEALKNSGKAETESNTIKDAEEVIEDAEDAIDEDELRRIYRG